MKTIEKAFHDAGLSLKPWHRQDEIFAVDIDGGEFLLARGNGNTIRVVASDPSMQQLVLMVHEHPRSFQVDVTTRSVLPTDTVIKREPGSIHVTVKRKVAGKTIGMVAMTRKCFGRENGSLSKLLPPSRRRSTRR